MTMIKQILNYYLRWVKEDMEKWEFIGISQIK
jgi:hypothetical protein